ncbi:TMEM175 family protein [Longispora sp. K20-0274]|uniref:TMEM175 family protein n=1 Tax=Longispora sp. K20-0274 TaxID=3088255 RepID=UPI0039997714
MTEVDAPDRKELDRLVFFSDAVIAIAITLLALELPVPEHVTNDAAAWHSLAESGGAYLMFLISFLIIGGFWRAHHGLFRHVTSLSRGLLFRNLICLLFITLIPWASKVLNDANDTQPGPVIYAAVLGGVGWTFLLLLDGVARGKLLAADTPPRMLREFRQRVGLPALVFTLSIPLAFLVSPQACSLSWISLAVLMPVAAQLGRRQDRRRTERGLEPA